MNADAPRPQAANAYIPFGYAEGRSSPGQVTIGTNFTLEACFNSVRLILANYGDTPMHFAGLCAAASASDASILDTENGSWVPVTVDGKVPSLPAGSSQRPAVVLSDLLPIQSLDRRDGGTGYLLYTRSAGPAEGPNTFNMLGLLGSTTEFNSGTPGRPITHFYCGGDHASQPDATGLTMERLASATLPTFVVAGVIFVGENDCHTFWGVGDSLTMGLGAGAGYSGFGRLAAHELNGSPRPVSYVDAGYPGQTTTQFLARAVDLLRAGVPVHSMTIPFDSANTYAAADGALSRPRQEAEILDFLGFVRGLDIFPVMVTSLPLMHGDRDICGTERAAGSDRLRRMRGDDLAVLDAQAIVAGYIPSADRPAVTPPDFLGADGSHLSEAAQSAIAADLVPILRAHLRAEQDAKSRYATFS